MKIHYIMHADFETVGVIEDWAYARGYQLTGHKPYKGERLPSANDLDFLIIMGGPQSPLELEKDPYLKDELVLIKDAIANDKKVLGFCLGAQLIGEALGGKTSRSPEKEVGVFPIQLTGAGQVDHLFQGFPDSFDVIHWHNDMPGATPSAELLATSAGCPQQAYRYKHNVYGLQFHMEITNASMQGMIANCPGDLKPARFVQSAYELAQQDLTPINNNMKLVLDRLVTL
jgi:GMP synthase (glutamine-hydrolysing)